MSISRYIVVAVARCSRACSRLPVRPKYQSKKDKSVKWSGRDANSQKTFDIGVGASVRDMTDLPILFLFFEPEGRPRRFAFLAMEKTSMNEAELVTSVLRLVTP